MHNSNGVSDLNNVEMTQIPMDRLSSTESSLPSTIVLKPNNSDESSTITRIKKWLSSNAEFATAAITNNKTLIKWILFAILIIAFHAYLVCALLYNASKATVLLVITIIVWIRVLFIYASRNSSISTTASQLCLAVEKSFNSVWQQKYTRHIFYISLVILLILFMFFDTWNDRERLTGLAGIVVFLILLIVGSRDRNMIRVRPVAWGFGAQFLLGLVVFRWDWGREVIATAAQLMAAFLEFTAKGTEFVYGFLSEPPNICGMAPVFAFSFLQIIVFVGSVVALLLYLGAIQSLLKIMKWCLDRTMGTTAAETLNAFCCIFLGQWGAPLVIQPYLRKMTSSELHAVMTSCFSCIAGSLFTSFMAHGVCPRILLASAILSAPCSLACSKIVHPEQNPDNSEQEEESESEDCSTSTPLECLSSGAVAAVQVTAAVASNIIVFIALLAFADSVVWYAGWSVGFDHWGLETLVATVLFPFVYVMGVTTDTYTAARLMATKMAGNERLAFEAIGHAQTEEILSPRALLISIVAVSSLSHLGSIGVQLGLLGALVPSRKRLISQLVFSAMVTGLISSLLTATLAGVLDTGDAVCSVPPRPRCFNTSYYEQVLAGWEPTAGNFSIRDEL